MTTTSPDTGWSLPDPNTVYHLEDNRTLTLGQMLEEVDPELIPSNQDMLDELLCAFGAWEAPDDLDRALAARTPCAGVGGKVGFKLVK